MKKKKTKRIKLTGRMIPCDPWSSAHWTPALEATKDANGIVHPEQLGLYSK
jgi:hypothetical protein